MELKYKAKLALCSAIECVNAHSIVWNVDLIYYGMSHLTPSWFADLFTPVPRALNQSNPNVKYIYNIFFAIQSRIVSLTNWLSLRLIALGALRLQPSLSHCLPYPSLCRPRVAKRGNLVEFVPKSLNKCNWAGQKVRQKGAEAAGVQEGQTGRGSAAYEYE